MGWLCNSVTRLPQPAGQRDRWSWYVGMIRDEPSEPAATGLSKATERP